MKGRGVEENPYQAPAVHEIEAPAATDAEAIRQKHLGHEASLKTIGLLCHVSGFLGCCSLAMAYYVGWYSGGQLPEFRHSVSQVLVWVLPIPLQFVVGHGLRRLAPWVRIPAGILFAVSFLRVPLGPLFAILGLYLVFGAKGRRVLSPGYREIIAQTPHLRYRRGSTGRLLLRVGLIALAVLIALAFFGG